ncbi:MAG TPA: hypothetical protein VMV46_01375 [Thermoanaerobaculia bacterium]|nr:hypothetical protein [Thermoanaerobaculia bacterium]
MDVLGHPEYGDERDDESLWEAIRPASEPSATRWFLPAVLLLLTVGTPWHATLGWSTAMWNGLPLWVWISLACGAGLSGVTAVAAVCAWRDPDLEPSDRAGTGSPTPAARASAGRTVR